MSIKLTTEGFIEKAIIIHKDKYDYSKVDYKNALTKVCIICPEHGEFWQLPHNHINGQNCPKCVKNNKIKLFSSNTEEFILKSKLVHCNKYDYSKINYINNYTKVCIICPKHGEFWQEPNSHLIGSNCPLCAHQSFISNTEEFILKSKLVHGDKYDYSKVNYIKSKTKVCIICKMHGEFWQEPTNHLQGKGCIICNESKLENEVSKILNDNNIDYECQKHFKWLGRQSLDFYLPLYQIAIECQGEQHFKPVDFGGKGEKWAEIKFMNNQKRDNYKLILCNKNNVKMIYYGNKKHNIELLNSDDLKKEITKWKKKKLY